MQQEKKISTALVFCLLTIFGFYCFAIFQAETRSKALDSIPSFLTRPHAATMPGSSDPTGDEWPMYRGALNHTGTTMTTPAQGTGPTWSYSTGSELDSSPIVTAGRVYMGVKYHGLFCLDATTGLCLWNRSMGGNELSTPAVAGGRIYIGCEDGMLHCLNAITGLLLWNYTTGSGVGSSPAVAGGRVYVGSDDHKVYCLNATTGMTIWSYMTGDWVFSSPAVVGGRLYVGGGDHKVYCLNATSGAKIWTYTTGSYVYSSPTVAGERVYVGSYDNKTYCLDATTGASVWNYTMGDYVFSSPAVAGGRVYVGSNDGKLYCLNANTGAFVWSYATAGGMSSPAIANGLVYKGSSDSNIYCLNATTGARVWNYTTGNYIYTSSPAIAGGHVYVGSEDYKLYCLPMILLSFSSNPTGDEWPMFHGALNHAGVTLTTLVKAAGSIWNYTTGDYVDSSPAVVSGRLYVGSADCNVYCLNATSGVRIWNYTTGGPVESSPAVAGGLVYVGSDDSKIYCLNTITGAIVWSYAIGSADTSSPAVSGGRVYMGCFNGKVFCLNATTGARIWNYTTENSVRSSPAIVDGRVYVGGDDGKVYCLNAITGAFVWSYVTGSAVVSSPAVTSGRVYVGSQDYRVYCLNATTGAYIWSYITNGAVESSPAVNGGLVYVGSQDNKVYCLNASTGAMIWKYTTGGWVWSSPAIAGEYLYVESYDKKTYCLNATTGAVIWSYNVGSLAQLSSPVVASGHVYVEGDMIVYCLPMIFGSSATFTANATTIIADQYVAFTHTGSNGNLPTTYQWNFGDGSANATVENPVHRYTTAGNFTVILTLVEKDGDSNKLIKYNYIMVFQSTAPSAPRNLQAIGENGQVTLWWQAPSSYGGSAITNYKIYRGSYWNCEIYLASVGNVTTYTDMNVNNEASYYYKVNAINSNCEGPLSNEASATPSTMSGAPFSSNPTSDEWPMFHRALNHTGTTTTTPVQAPGPIWSYITSIDYVYSSPAIAGGRVYVGSCDGKVYCLNATTGTLVWSYTTGNWVFSSPAVADGRVFVGSEDNKMYCLNATTGSSIWNYTTGDLVVSSPAVASGLVFVGSNDHKVYCLNATTGAFVWSYTTGDQVLSSPSVAGGRVYVGSYDGKVYCLNATTGTRLWNYSTSGKISYSSPVIADGRMYVGSDYPGHEIYCLDAATGSFIWSCSVGSVISTPAVAGGCVYVGSLDNKIYCLNAIIGTLVWTYTTGDLVISSPAVANGLVYVGSYDDKMYCLNSTTGAFIWSYATGLIQMVSSPAVANGRVYVGSGVNYNIYCFPMIFGPFIPSITHPSDITYNQGTTGNSISWTITALSNGTTSYTIYRNGTLLTSGTWASGIPIAHDVDGLPIGKFNYTIVASDGLGGSAQDTVIVTVTVTSLPSAPRNLLAIGGDSNASLTWQTPSSNGGAAITGYVIYRGITPGGEVLLVLIGNVTNFVDTSLVNGHTYYYKVSASNAVGEGALSNEASATPVTVPSTPLSFIAIPGHNSVLLSWTTPVSNGGSAIMAYNVYRGTMTNGEKFLIKMGNMTTFNASGLTNGQIYYFIVQAVNSVGNGTNSSEASATPSTVPGAPAIISATFGNTQVMVTWTDPGNGGAPITGYNINYGITSGHENKHVLVPGATATTGIVTGLTNGVLYYFNVTATNLNGNSTSSAELSAMPMTVPSQPQQLHGWPYDTFVLLFWDEPASNGGSAITDYLIYMGTISGGETFLINSGNLTFYNASGLTNGITYYFKVQAVNDVGMGANSTEASVMPATVPTEPYLWVMPENAQVVLNWIVPWNNGGSAITNYLIYQGTTSGGETPLIMIGNVTTYNASGLTNGITYYFKVQAVNGVGMGANSTEENATPATTSSAPQAFTATAGNGHIVLNWVVPVSNGGSAITNYAIYQGTTPGGETSLIMIGNVTNYNASGLTNGQIYYFKVLACNAMGPGENATEVSATPTAVPSAPRSLATSPGNAQIVLTWIVPASDGGSAITGYNIYVGTTTSNEKLNGTVAVLTDTIINLKNGQLYYFSVCAVNMKGTSTNATTSATPATVPDVPGTLTPTAGNLQVILTWTVPGSNGGSAITGYRIYVGTTTSNEKLNATVTVLTDTVTNLKNGVLYYFSVCAVNVMGTGANATTSAIPATVPGQPGSFTATAGANQVTLNWTAPSTGGSPITGYNVYQGTTLGGETLRETISAMTNYLATGLTNGQIYYFKVQAVNVMGNGINSTENSATPMTVPTAPRNLQGTSRNGQISLLWQVPSSNGGSAITSYKIYRSNTPGNEINKAIVGNTNGYNDTNVTDGQRYYYIISALNIVGEGSHSIETSVIASFISDYIGIVNPLNATYTNMFILPLVYSTNISVNIVSYRLDNLWIIPSTNTTMNLNTFANDSNFYDHPHFLQLVVVDTSSRTLYSPLRWFTIQIVNETGARLQFTLRGTPDTKQANLYHLTIVMQNVGTLALRLVLVYYTITAESGTFAFTGIAAFILPLQPGDNRTISATVTIASQNEVIYFDYKVIAEGYKETSIKSLSINSGSSFNYTVVFIFCIEGLAVVVAIVGGMKWVSTRSKKAGAGGKKKMAAASYKGLKEKDHAEDAHRNKEGLKQYTEPSTTMAKQAVPTKPSENKRQNTIEYLTFRLKSVERGMEELAAKFRSEEISSNEFTNQFALSLKEKQEIEAHLELEEKASNSELAPANMALPRTSLTMFSPEVWQKLDEMERKQSIEPEMLEELFATLKEMPQENRLNYLEGELFQPELPGNEDDARGNDS